MWYTLDCLAAARTGFIHSDHLGSTSLTTDITGTVVAETRYLPYGEERWITGTLVTDFTFTGQRAERGFALMDYNARYYDPGLGRFVSADTVVPDFANPQALNRYAYTLGNPLRYTDPSGHQEKPQLWEKIRQFFKDAVEKIRLKWALHDPGLYPLPRPKSPYEFGWNQPLLGGECPECGQAVEWAQKLQPLVSQFGRAWGPNRGIGPNEDVPYTGEGLQISTGEKFQGVIHGQHGDLATKYLWTIDEQGIKIAPETTPFDTKRGNIVHTNLSPSGAFAGGELWFVSDDEIVINAGSGRYGYSKFASRQDQEEAAHRYGIAVEMFQELGYVVNAISAEQR
jgi:RHS repeat-associated protein